MNNKLSSLLKNLANKVVYAEKTLSEYYTIGCIKVRVSDHIATDMDCDLGVFYKNIGKQNVYVIIPFVGTFKELQWFTNVNDAIAFITKFEEMARILIKYPVQDVNQQEDRQEKNIIASINALSNDTTNNNEKINKFKWNKSLSCFYAAKKGELFASIVDKIYELSGNENTFKQLCKISSLPNEKKLQYLNNLLETLK